MSAGFDTEAQKEAARREIEFLGELRRSAFEQHTQSYRWLTASLLAVNGGAAIAVLNADNILPVLKVDSGAFFSGGILAALLVAVLGQQANMKSLIPIQKQVGYWISVASDGIRDEQFEQSMMDEGRPALRFAKAGQAVGWLSAMLFVSGLVCIGLSITKSPNSVACSKIASASDPSCVQDHQIHDR